MSKSSKAVIGAATDPWKYINKCMTCGSKMIFQPNANKKNPRPEEGMKYCEHGHNRLTIHGGYNAVGIWHYTFIIP